MHRVGKFEKVSWKQFQSDYVDIFGENTTINMDDVRYIYDQINLPIRATTGSAGYDFKSPIAFKLKPGETIKIPTGIRAQIEDGWVLKIYPRSSLGFKYRLQIDNTVGIVDSDYYHSDNEGHIFIKITNCTNQNKEVVINAGDGIVQGIFELFGVTYDDNVEVKRNGGLGSTNN